MIFEDEPVPGYSLPILPGHVSPGRLERVVRAGKFAVTTEISPPDSADPQEVYERARSMAYRQEEAVAEIINSSGVLEGCVPWYPERNKDLEKQRKVS